MTGSCMALENSGPPEPPPSQTHLRGLQRGGHVWATQDGLSHVHTHLHNSKQGAAPQQSKRCRQNCAASQPQLPADCIRHQVMWLARTNAVPAPALHGRTWPSGSSAGWMSPASVCTLYCRSAEPSTSAWGR